MKHVSCSCGYLVSAETGEELLTAVEAHIASSHGAREGATAEPEDNLEAAELALKRRDSRDKLNMSR
jgi:predicted small metal-binding protein